MKTDITVIGAGVIGLAVAAEISRTKEEVVVLEKHPSFGHETSSRNSEVIHAGLYYPKDSLRGQLCVEGKHLLYDYCEKEGIPHRRIGKVIVAAIQQESGCLDDICHQGEQNGIDDLKFLSAGELSNRYSKIKGTCALYSPSTGIIDSHALMKRLEQQAIKNSALISYNTEVIDIDSNQSSYSIKIREADGTLNELISEVVINCGGLHASRLAQMVGIDIVKYSYGQRFSKGEYFRLNHRNAIPNNVLVYRARSPKTIGIHTVVDLAGELKLGPLSSRTDGVLDFKVNPQHRHDVFQDCRQFLPLLKEEDLSPDMSGISPTVDNGNGDFIISEESGKGLPGFINLIGMKSPALTSCLAIAQRVASICL